MATRVGNTSLSYDPNNIIGRGSCGTTVFQGFHTVFGSDKPVAVKRIVKSSQHAAESAILREVELMKKVKNHFNILRYICTETDDNFLFIVTELCSGTLEDYVIGKCQLPKFEREKEMLRQVTQGLEYLHNLGIVHRDIKPSNILIFVPSSLGLLECKPQIKLADFGISKALNPDKSDFTNTSVTNPNGTRGWMAPEVYESDRFDFKVDIWALGLIFAYTLSGGKHPFGDDINERIYRIMKKGDMILVRDDVKKPYSEDGKAFKLIQMLLEMEPENRPTADGVLKSPFFKVVNNIPAKPIDGFSKNLTQEFMDTCCTLFNPMTDEKIAKFKELVNDERVDIFCLQFNYTTPLYAMCGGLYLPYYCPGQDHEKLTLEIVQLLVLKGADINNHKGRGFSDEPSLLHALCHNVRLSGPLKIELAQLLIQNGADVNIKASFWGTTPVHYYCEHYFGNPIYLVNMLHLLIQNGADVNTTNRIGYTPLHELCKKSYNPIDLFRLLIENGADVNANANYKQETPLFCACQHQFENERLIDVVRLLIENGADVNKRNADGYSPLDVLCMSYKRKHKMLMEMVKLMMASGADIHAGIGNSGNSPWGWRWGSTPFETLRKRGVRLYKYNIY